MATFKARYRGIGELLKSPAMQAEMLRRAEKAKGYAEATAPRDTGHFADSFRVEGGIGGTHNDRAVGRLVNDDSAALSIEYGTKDTPAHRTLRRSLDAMKD